MIKVIPDNQIPEVVQEKAVARYIPEPTQTESTGAGLLGFVVGSTICGLGGYALGKKHGYTDGYDQAKAEDGQLIAQYQPQIQKLRREHAFLSAENSRLIQENEILKNLLKQQPSTPQIEAVLETLGRVEFRLIQALPPIFEDGGDHDTEQN